MPLKIVFLRFKKDSMSQEKELAHDHIEPLEFIGKQYLENPKLQLFSFNKEEYIENKDFSIDQLTTLCDGKYIYWLNVHGLHDVELIKYIGSKLEIHFLVIQDFQKYVIEYTNYIKSTIAWILSLPAKLLALFQDCLNRLYQLLSGIFSDVLGSTGGGLGDTIKDAQELAQTTISSAVAITSAVTSLPISLAAAISVPPSAESVAAAGEAITGYFDSLPSAEDANAGNQKSKSP